MKMLHKVPSNFTVIPNTTFTLPGLSPVARGILLWALSRGEDWGITQKKIRNALWIKKHAVASAIKNLVGLKVCHHFKVYDSSSRGRLSSQEYVFTSKPTSRESAQKFFESVRVAALGDNLVVLREQAPKIHQEPNYQVPDGQAPTKRPLLRKEIQEESNLRGNESLREKTPSSKTLKGGVQCTRYVEDKGNGNGVQRTPSENPVLPSEKTRAMPEVAHATREPRPVEVGPSNIDLLPVAHEDVACAWLTKDVLRWCREGVVDVQGRAEPVAGPHDDSGALALQSDVHRRLFFDGLKIMAGNPPASDPEAVSSVRKFGTLELATAAWETLSAVDQAAFTAGCRSPRGPLFELRAILAAKELLKWRGPPVSPFPRATLSVTIAVDLPAPTWPVDPELMSKVSNIFCRAWAARYGRDYRFRSGNEVKRLATVVQYEMGGDLKRFVEIADIYVAMDDKFLVAKAHHPNFLAKQWRTLPGT